MTRKKDGTFAKGISGNPSGRPRAENALVTVPYRLDGWQSALTGIGTLGRDKRLSHSFTATSLSYQEAIELWRADDIAKRAIEFVPGECFREGYEVIIADESKYADLKEQVEARLKELNADAIVERAMHLENAVGGAAILMGANDSRSLETPLDADRVNALDWLTVLEPLELQPWKYYDDPSKAKYGEPELYSLQASASSPILGPNGAVVGQRAVSPKVHLIHESRLIVLPGRRVSRFAQRTSTTGSAFWGDSALIYLSDILRDYNVAWQAAGIIATDFSQPVFSIDNLMSIVAKNPTALRDRMAALEMGRSVARAVLIDTREKFTRETTSITGLPDLLDRLSARLSLAIDLPLAFLLGTSPKNIGDNGDNDVRMFYDRIGSIQTRKVAPILERIIRPVMRTTGKKRMPKKWSIQFNELWQLTDKERADAHLTQARSDQIYTKIGVLYPDEIRKSRFGGGYSYKTQIEEHKEAPGFLAPLPAGVAPGTVPAVGIPGVLGAGAPGSPKAMPTANAHSVGGYARRNPTASPLGKNTAGDNGSNVDRRRDAIATYAQMAGMSELDYQRQKLAEAEAASAEPGIIAVLKDLVALCEAEAANPVQDSDGPGQRILFAGFPVVIESPKGSVRQWVDTDGTPGQTTMKYDYGYIDNSLGSDGDSVDVYLGPSEDAPWVYVVHQNSKASGFTSYDEDKAMIGFDSANHARDAYLRQYDDERFIGGMSQMSVEDFRRKVMLSAGGRITHGQFDDVVHVDFIEKRGENWVVVSHEGRDLGEFATREAAAKRLRQVEYFKSHPEKDEESEDEDDLESGGQS